VVVARAAGCFQACFQSDAGEGSGALIIARRPHRIHFGGEAEYANHVDDQFENFMP
jgi:hypothetical protein